MAVLYVVIRYLASAVGALLVGGGVFASDSELARGVASHAPQQPQLAIDAAGTIHVVYGAGSKVRYRASDNGGKSFTEEKELDFARAMSLGMRRGPRIAVAGKSICLTAIGGKQGKGRDGDLLAVHSVDKGKSWSDPVVVNDVSDAAREGLHAMAAGMNGELCCVWLDLRNKATEVMAAVSSDGGRTWAKNVLVYKSPSGSVCECCHPSVAFDERGKIHVQWRNSLHGARDLYVAVSSDKGKSFGEVRKLGKGSWKLEHCPMDGGAISLVDGKLSSAWRRDTSIYLAIAGEAEERRLGVGEQPWIAATEAGPYVVWLAERGGAAYLMVPGAKSPVELGKFAYEPVIASGPNGSAPLVAAWESRDGKESVIHCRIVQENRQNVR